MGLDVEELRGLLRQALDEARTQWPGVELDPDLFVRHVAARLPRGDVSSGVSLPDLFSRLSLGELYLACACQHGNPAAISAFERRYLSRLPEMLGQLRQPASAVDEICQMTRVRILVRTPDGEPRIADYKGEGALLSWVRVTAARVSLTLLASERPAGEGAADLLEALPAPGVDAELDLIKRRHRSEFREALREAFAAIPEEDRHLLKLYFADRLTTTELGALFRVNQSTISRRLKAVREAVHDGTRRCLQARLGLSTGELQSFLAALTSQLDEGLSQIFGEEDAQAGTATGGR